MLLVREELIESWKHLSMSFVKHDINYVSPVVNFLLPKLFRRDLTPGDACIFSRLIFRMEVSWPEVTGSHETIQERINIFRAVRDRSGGWVLVNDSGSSCSVQRRR